jgi:hypothetical protein
MNTEKKSNKDEMIGSNKVPTVQSIPTPKVKEYGGRKEGLDPTRYGDWEKNGRCIDF